MIFNEKLFIVLSMLPLITLSFPEQGKWDFTLNETNTIWAVYKSLFNESRVYAKIQCSSVIYSAQVFVSWRLRETPCWEEYASQDFLSLADRKNLWQRYFDDPTTKPVDADYSSNLYITGDTLNNTCDNSIKIPEYKMFQGFSGSKINIESFENKQLNPIFQVDRDGIYMFIIQIISDKPFTANIHVEMKSDYGYLSAADWPLLHFYGVNCIIYIGFALIWLCLSSCQWRELLRIQFWIGGLIGIGMLEMAIFYAEYQSINSTGVSVPGAILFAEIVSAAKRTLSRILVLQCSMGFGIVKPRLGDTFHRILLVGAVYFCLASIECSLRIFHPVNGPSQRPIMAEIPLSILDAGICWWIFHSLHQTSRTLRLRRNLVKLGLYRNFTNTLIFAVVTSIAFIVWSIRYLRTVVCLRDWKEIWVDTAFWHALFSLILLVIIILWRPTNNNQRYSFTPLVDNPDDEEEDLVVFEAFGENMKLRPKKGSSEKFNRNNKDSLEDEIRWVEENIPADFAEGDLPAIDSEEELISTKFELSKMQ